MVWRRLLLCTIVVFGCNRNSGPGKEHAENQVDAPALAVETNGESERVDEPPVQQHPPSPDERIAFDLIDNRHLAHRHRNGFPVLDPGTPGFGKYMRMRFAGLEWELGREQDGIPIARAQRDATLTVPLAPEHMNTVRSLIFRVHTRERRRWRVTVNRSVRDKHAFSTVLSPGWQTVEVPLTAADIQIGANVIHTRHTRRTPLSVAWVQVGGKSTAAPIPLWSATIDGSDKGTEEPTKSRPSTGALSFHRGDGLSYHVFVPSRATMTGEVAETGCAFDISATDADGVSVQGTLPGRIALGEMAGRIVRLSVRARGCERATLSRAAIVVPGTESATYPAPPPRYIVLWIMDTLRADKMRTVNPDARAEIPTLAKLAETGAAFRQYYVQGNESQTSHSSVWTSLYPANHGVITSGPLTRYTLSKRFERLGPLMKDAGLRTVGVTANGTIIPWSGYTRGFDVFNNIMRDGTGKRLGHRVPGDLVFERAMEKVGDDVSEPMFLFIGTTDTHKPWYGHQPWLDRYDPGPYKGRFETHVLSSRLGIPKGTHLCYWDVPEREMQRIHAIYDSAISFQDAQLGRLIEQLEQWGIRDQTMIVVTADHGEELWEHPRRCGHGSSLRQTLVHVPLLIHYPPLIPHTVVDTGVDGVDILPTLLETLGRPPLEAAQGESLIPLLQGRHRDYPRPSYASMNELSHTMRITRFKATINRRGRLSLYDIEDDPFEHKNIAADRPIERQLLSDTLTLFMLHRKQWKKRDWGVASNISARGAAAMTAAMRSR